MKPFRAILWDLDGTLVNTAEQHFQSTQSTLQRYHFAFDRETFNASFGMADHTILGNASPGMPEAAFEQMVAEKNALYLSLIQEQPLHLLPGVRTWLETFQNWGCQQAIASTTFAQNIRIIAARLEITAYFEAFVSSSHYNLPSKPNPAVFLKAATLLNTPPEHCLVIEDAPAGVEAARQAGMKCLAVGTSNPLEQLQHAHLVVRTLEHLQPDHLTELALSSPPA